MCVDKYIEIYRNNSPKDWKENVELEKLGNRLVSNFEKYRDSSLEFINRVEKWKSMGIDSRVKGVGFNNKEQAIKAIRNILSKNTPKEKIECLHVLRGFGISKNINSKTRPAKVASAAMRFLYPTEWGVVDWRSGAVANTLIVNDFNIPKTKIHLLKHRKSYSAALTHIDSDWAIYINDQYRIIGNNYLVDQNSVVDQFLFALSFEIWPNKRFAPKGVRAEAKTCRKFCKVKIRAPFTRR